MSTATAIATTCVFTMDGRFRCSSKASKASKGCGKGGGKIGGQGCEGKNCKALDRGCCLSSTMSSAKVRARGPAAATASGSRMAEASVRLRDAK